MKAVIICNPHSGKRSGNIGLRPAVDILEASGWTISVCETTQAGDATRIAREAVETGHGAVLVAGGDGTINETIQALAGTETAMGYLPYGTVNIWAREAGIPLDVSSAASSMAEGRIEQVDLGTANHRYFLLMSGVGFDGEVIGRARSIEKHKHRLGIFPYIISGLSAAPLFRGADVELRYDGLIRRVQALMVVVSNTRLYGGRFEIAPEAIANDGWLDLCIVKGRGPLALSRRLLPLLLSRSVAHSDVEFIRVKDLRIRANKPLHVQLDGELAGMTPVHITVVPRALRVIVPRNLSSGLLS